MTLVERVERLTGPDREVDAEIACKFPEYCIWNKPEKAYGFKPGRGGKISYRSPGYTHYTFASEFTKENGAAQKLAALVAPNLNVNGLTAKDVLLALLRSEPGK